MYSVSLGSLPEVCEFERSAHHLYSFYDFRRLSSSENFDVVRASDSAGGTLSILGLQLLMLLLPLELLSTLFFRSDHVFLQSLVLQYFLMLILSDDFYFGCRNIIFSDIFLKGYKTQFIPTQSDLQVQIFMTKIGARSLKSNRTLTLLIFLNSVMSPKKMVV